MIPFSKQEKEFIKRIHLLSDIPEKDVREVFEGLLYYAVFSYVNKEPIYIPLLGNIYLYHEDDIETKKGLKASVRSEFEISQYFNKVVGQIKDGETSDLQKHLIEKIKKELQKHYKE